MKKFILSFVLMVVLPLAVIFGAILFFANHVTITEVGKSDTSSTSVILPPTSNEVEAAINDWRVSEGLARFNSDVPVLDRAAQARAEGMCKENDWSHANDWVVLDQYYSYSYAGENLYYGSLQPKQDDDAVKTWVASPSHLANLQADYSQIGIGVKACPGFQGNNEAVIITNYFGVPR